MKKLYFLFFTFLITSLSFGQTVTITRIVDGGLPSDGCSGSSGSSSPKVIELYVDGTIDFNGYTYDMEANGGAISYQTTDLSSFGSISDQFVYIVALGETTFDEIVPGATKVVNGNGTFNGDDYIRITDGTNILDEFGVLGEDGSGKAWEYLDSYAKRIDGEGPNNSFTIGEWSFGSVNELDGVDCSTLSSSVGFGNYSTTPSTTPTINVSTASGSMFYWETMGPSDEETFTVSGINLTADIVVNAPTNYEISTTSGSGFGASVNLSPSSGTVNSTTIYVRLKTGLIEGSYNEDVTCTSTGAANGTVSLTGTVGADDPNIFVSNFPGDLEYVEGSGPSSEDDFTVSGLFLTENILVTAPTNFEVSLTSGSGFGNSVSVTQTGGTAAETTVYVRLAGSLTAAGSPYSGDVTCSSAGATNETVSLDGVVNPVAACSSVGDIIITEIMQNPDNVSDGNGEYFEVYNTTGSAIDMIGWTISDADFDSHTITSNLSVPGNGYAVLGINADSGTNGGVTVNYEYSGINMSNSADEIILTCSSTIIDQVYYDGGPNFPDPTGASMELSTNAMNATDNDNGANWGESTGGPLTAGDSGTPGSANSFTLSNDNFEIESFKMHPNPTSLGYVNISSKSSSKMEVSVFDLLGKRVIKEEVNDNQLDVSALRSGVYIMKVNQEEASATRKLVIQ